MDRVLHLNRMPTGMNDFRWFRQIVQFFERLVPFVQTSFSPKGLGSSGGRRLIVGKIRRILICMVPPLAEALQRKHGISNGCSGCGTSCNLLFRCPHWDSSTRLCTVYEDRPNVCKFFPITPADIRDRDLLSSTPCGFKFKS